MSRPSARHFLASPLAASMHGMKPIAFWYWFLPDLNRPGNVYRTGWRMTEEQAKGYSGAVKD